MNEEASAGENETSRKRTYILRKLCSNTEEYEALPRERLSIDFELLAKRLEAAGFMEVAVQGQQLTVLMEDIGVVASVHPGGTLHLQASLMGDCERACDIIFALTMMEECQVGKNLREESF